MPLRISPPNMQRRAAELRHHQTEAEVKLWAHLRSHRLKDIHFRRQFAIGNYIVDFCAPRQKLVIELDGSQHLDQKEYDQNRTEYLNAQGFRVLRFWNNEVMNNLEGVIFAMSLALSDRRFSK